MNVMDSIEHGPLAVTRFKAKADLGLAGYGVSGTRDGKPFFFIEAGMEPRYHHILDSPQDVEVIGVHEDPRYALTQARGDEIDRVLRLLVDLDDSLRALNSGLESLPEPDPPHKYVYRQGRAYASDLARRRDAGRRASELRNKIESETRRFNKLADRLGYRLLELGEDERAYFNVADATGHRYPGCTVEIRVVDIEGDMPVAVEIKAGGENDGNE